MVIRLITQTLVDLQQETYIKIISLHLEKKAFFLFQHVGRCEILVTRCQQRFILEIYSIINDLSDKQIMVQTYKNIFTMS